MHKIFYDRDLRVKKRLVAVLTAFMLCLCVCNYTSFGTYASQSGEINSGVTNVNFRESPGGDVVKDAEGTGIRLNGGQQLKILDTSNSSWYKVEASIDGQNYTGYVSSQYVSVTGSSSDTQENVTAESDQENGETVSDESESTEQETVSEDVSEDLDVESLNLEQTDDDFEKQLESEGFPESYRVLLREIHKLHPTWTFKAVQTGIEWSTLVDKEINKSGQIKNLVYGAPSYPRYNWRATSVGYNWATDTWSPYDGSTWYAASDDLISYYLDPRTYLYENYVFVFESLSYQQGMQTEAGVEAILAGSFMANTVPKGESKTYAQIIMEAAAQSGVSPYHLASRIKQEMGDTMGTASSGTNSRYPGIYNFYNIGATDSASTSAAENGLKWAATPGTYNRPWNSVSKSIINGAQYLAASYIKVGQDTVYTQKFNVTNRANLFSHQYMTNVQAPATEAPKTFAAYKANNILDSSLVFKIPVYENMPSTAVAKPADSGNPNNWLKTLSVDGYGLTPTFSVSSTTNYSLIVSESTSSININASTVNANAKISGTGTVNLSQGTNTININVTAQNGSMRTYTLTVVRGSANEGNTTINGTTTSGQKGDLNGDGKISAADIVKLQRIIVGLDTQTSTTLALGDLNGDGKISAMDIVKIQRHIVGLETIQ